MNTHEKKRKPYLKSVRYKREIKTCMLMPRSIVEGYPCEYTMTDLSFLVEDEESLGGG